MFFQFMTLLWSRGQGWVYSTNFKALGIVWAGSSWRKPQRTLGALDFQESWWMGLTTGCNLFSETQQKGSRAISTGNTDGESFSMLRVGGTRNKPEMKCSNYHRKWIQIKHCKQNSGEDWAISLCLVADNPVAGIEGQWSVTQFLPTMSYFWVYHKDNIISQWWMRSKEERGGLY